MSFVFHWFGTRAFRWGLVAVIGGIVGLSTPQGVWACGQKVVVRDYLAPLKKAAPLNEPLMSGRIPFAPSGMSLEINGAGLVVGGGEVGFTLADEAIQPPRRLDWIVETKLLRTDARGKVISSASVKRRRIGWVQGDATRNLLHEVPRSPAYYRLEIRFIRRGTDHILGRYGTYVRVMKPRVDLRVIIETPSVLPGELATARLVNLGTVPLITPSYDFGFGVQTFTSEKWIRVPDNPQRLVPKRMGPWTLPAGMETRGCLRYLVPTDQPPGLFRFAALGPSGEDLLTAEFEVRAAT